MSTIYTCRQLMLASLASLSAVLAGCAHTPAVVEVERSPSRAGEVGVSEITELVPAAGRMVIADNETFFMPLASHDNALPPYPTALLAQRLPPQATCLRVSIDIAGAVMDAAPIVQPPDCPTTDAVDRQFFDAAIGAAREWRFDAAFRCEYPNELARSAGDCSGGREVRQAVSLAYRFVFEQREGRGSVRIGQ